MTYSVGIDVGTGVVKTALFKVDGNNVDWLVKRSEHIPGAIPMSWPRNP